MLALVRIACYWLFEEEMLASSQYLSVEFDWIGCEWIGCIRVWRHQNIGVCDVIGGV